MQVASGGAFTSALITIIKYNDYREILDPIPGGIINLLNLDPNDLFLRTEAMAWLAMVIAGIAILVGLVALVGRICDCTDKNSSRIRRIYSGLVSEFQWLLAVAL